MGVLLLLLSFREGLLDEDKSTEAEGESDSVEEFNEVFDKLPVSMGSGGLFNLCCVLCGEYAILLPLKDKK